MLHVRIDTLVVRSGLVDFCCALLRIEILPARANSFNQ
jgi:hypothetical protein